MKKKQLNFRFFDVMADLMINLLGVRVFACRMARLKLELL
jgi:hypothetical protein